ncbi:dynein regulatory complex subunit 2 [Augochlora pura]
MPPKRGKQRRAKAKPANTGDLKRQALAREMKISATNLEKYRTRWQETLTRIEMPNVRKKIKMVWSSLEHAFDFQDYSISLLLDALREAEDQRRKMNGVHANLIDQTFGGHQTRLKVAEAFFQRRVETLLDDRTREFEEMRLNRTKNEANIRKINLLVNYRIENNLNAVKSTAISKVNAFVEDGRNERRMITAQLQKQLEDVWDQLGSIFSAYRTSLSLYIYICIYIFYVSTYDYIYT